MTSGNKRKLKHKTTKEEKEAKVRFLEEKREAKNSLLAELYPYSPEAERLLKGLMEEEEEEEEEELEPEPELSLVKPKEHRLRKLGLIHKLAIEYKLQGYTNQEIAKKINKSYWTVKNWFSYEPLVIKTLEQRKQELVECGRTLLLGAVRQAAETIIRMASSEENTATVLNAAKDILDRVGLKAGQRIEFTGAGGGPIEIKHSYTLEQQKEIFANALEALKVLEQYETAIETEGELVDGDNDEPDRVAED